MDPVLLVRVLLALALLVAVAAVIRLLWDVPVWWDPVVATVRAIFQLALLAAALTFALGTLELVAVALVVMLIFGIWTATRRIAASWHIAFLVGVSIVVSVVCTLSIVFGCGALELTPQNLLAYGGIVTGNSMSIVTLAGRRLSQDVDEHWAEVEGWLALGATPRQSLRTIASRSMSEALIPQVDQTRVTGIVTMPGAFVGAIFAGASPLDAGRFQILVLAGIMFAGTAAAAILMRGMNPISDRYKHAVLGHV